MFYCNRAYNHYYIFSNYFFQNMRHNCHCIIRKYNLLINIDPFCMINNSSLKVHHRLNNRYDKMDKGQDPLKKLNSYKSSIHVDHIKYKNCTIDLYMIMRSKSLKYQNYRKLYHHYLLQLTF